VATLTGCGPASLAPPQPWDHHVVRATATCLEISGAPAATAASCAGRVQAARSQVFNATPGANSARPRVGARGAGFQTGQAGRGNQATLAPGRRRKDRRGRALDSNHGRAAQAERSCSDRAQDRLHMWRESRRVNRTGGGDDPALIAKIGAGAGPPHQALTSR
jgi:hypothetical protein